MEEFRKLFGLKVSLKIRIILDTIQLLFCWRDEYIEAEVLIWLGLCKTSAEIQAVKLFIYVDFAF